jgi:Gram-negative bacterial TonB protein C-terminal
MRLLALLIFGLVIGRAVLAQDLPIMRRLLILTPAFIDSAELRGEAAPIIGDRSQVVVLFRLSERGLVIDTRANGGSGQAKKSALDAVRMWRFRPTLLNGRPVQMMSGAAFDFSVAPVKVQAPMPMPAEQISPVLSTRCSLALIKKDADAATICKKESAAVEKNRIHTAMESLSAHDELGLALLQFGHDPKGALSEFTRVIELAPEGLSSSDGEWARIYWHRAAAEQQIGLTSAADLDFSTAEKSLESAAQTVQAGSKGYRDLLGQLVKQHASVLETAGRHEEATALLSKFVQ